MAITVSPTSSDNNYDISLETATTKYGLILSRATGNRLNPIEPDPTAIIPAMVPRTAFKTSVGDGKYSDLEPPYFAVAQDNWNGGRGLNDFDLDQTRFMDSLHANTSGQGVICGAKETRASGTSIALDLQQNFYSETLGAAYLQTQFVAPANMGLRCFFVRVKHTFAQASDLRWDLQADSGGAPSGPFLATGYISRSGIDGDFVNILVPIVYTSTVIPYALTSGTTYWVSFHSATGGWDIGCNSNAPGHTLYGTRSGWGPVRNDQSIYLYISDIGKGTQRLFEYKGAMYVINQPDDFTAPKLFMNGYRGVAVTNSADMSLIKFNQTITESLVGKIVLIYSGTGSNEEFPYRTIMTHTTGASSYASVDRPWNIAHDNTTEWVVLGCDSWKPITGASSPTKPVTDICVTHENVYFGQGKDTAIVRFNGYNNAGTWTNRFSADSANMDFLKLVPTDTGTMKIWGARAQDCTIWSADPVTTWTNLTFAQKNGGKACGSTDRRITGLIGYGDPQIPFVLKEGSIGGISKDIYAEAPLGEMDAVRAYENGRAATQSGAYLYFSLLKGVEQFYNNDLRDLGPNRDEGLPTGRIGPVYAMKSYPGKILLAMDAGHSGDSSVLEYTNPGYHEIFRAPNGFRVRSIAIQVMPGDAVDRLWISAEEDLYWIPIDPNPRKCPTYIYNTGTQVESGWISAGRKDTRKSWAAVKLFSENLVVGAQYVTFEYMVDNQTSWTMLGTFNISPRHELPINVTSYRIKYRLTLVTTSTSLSPWVQAVVLEGTELLPVKYAFSMTFIITDEGIDLEGDEVSDNRAETKWNVLMGWMNTSTILTMHSRYSLWDNRTVKIQSLTARPMRINEEIESHLASMELMDV